MGPWMETCFRADSAEARGDAEEALVLLSERMLGPDGTPHWRPSRVRRLMQLVLLGPVLPGWATSRWIVDQAAQCLLVEGRARTLAGLDRALTARGVTVADLPGVDEVDARCRVIDHDWVFRQSYLHELGGLQAFLDQAAAADLVAGADRINDWVGAPMAAVRLLSEGPASVRWERLGDGTPVETANIGSAAVIERGECAIGRLVPVREGEMFESHPLVVPESVAVAVAQEPACWLEALTEGYREFGEPEINLRMHDFGLLHDVPHLVWQVEVAHRGGFERGDGPGNQPVDFFPLVMACARRLLTGDSTEPGQLDPWACLAAALLEPPVLRDIAARSTADDRECLARLADVLAEPAASACRVLAEGNSLAA